MIRPATSADQEALAGLLQQVIDEGTNYVYDHTTPALEVAGQWLSQHCYVVEMEKRVLGAYCLKANHPGRGSHVANGSYLIDESARGEGWGRKLAEHSLQQARQLGFEAMQFNLVVANNPAARLWERLGFVVVGRLPQVFRDIHGRDQDALVMFRKL